MNARTERILTPYPGLRPFEEEDNPIFFGREAETIAMLRQLAEQHFVAVVGSSGSGKSSLVRAGLLPAVRRGFLGGSKNWLIVPPIKPGHDPYGRLASALAKVIPEAEAQQSDDQGQILEAQLKEQLSDHDKGLLEVLASNNLPPDANVLLVVDQFEELFAFRNVRQTADFAPRDECAAFVSMLLRACADDGRIWVVLTMRSDFIGDCEAFLKLPERVSNSQFLVPRLDRSQMAEAICGPCDLTGYEFVPFTFEDGLVNHFINEAGDRPDQLPLMQHALMRTWSLAVTRARDISAKTPQLTEDDYRKVGGIERALSLHANEALEAIKNDALKTSTARRLFLTLCDVSPDGQITRRRPKVAEVTRVTGASLIQVESIVQLFQVDHRNFIICSPADRFSSNTHLDVSHEALFRQWEALTGVDVCESGWLSQERSAANEIRRLVQDAEFHKKGIGALLDPIALERVREWQEKDKPTKEWALRYVKDSEWDAAMQYVEASRKEVERKQSEEAAKLKREQEQEAERIRREQEQETMRLRVEQEKETMRLRREQENKIDRLRLKQEAYVKYRRIRLLFLAITLTIFAIAASIATFNEKEAERNSDAAGKSEQEALNSQKKTTVALEALQLQKDQTDKLLEDNKKLLAKLNDQQLKSNEIAKGAQARSKRFLDAAKEKLRDTETIAAARVQALHELAIAVRADRGNVEANHQTCLMLTRESWLPPLTPQIHTPLAGVLLLCASFGPNGDIFAVSRDGKLWKCAGNGSPFAFSQSLLPQEQEPTHNQVSNKPSTGYVLPNINPDPIVKPKPAHPQDIAPPPDNQRAPQASAASVPIHPSPLPSAFSSASFSDDGRHILVFHNPSSIAKLPTCEIWGWSGKVYEPIGDLIELGDRTPYHNVLWSKNAESFLLTRWDESSCSIYQVDGGSFDNTSTPPHPDRKGFSGHKFATAAFSPDGSTIATVKFDSLSQPSSVEINLLDTDSLKPVTHQGPGESPLRINFSVKPSQILFGPSRYQMTIQAWGQPAMIVNVTTGKVEERTFSGNVGSDSMMRLVYSSASPQVLPRIAALFSGRVEIYSKSNLTQHLAEPICFRGTSGFATFSNDGRKLLTLSGSTWNAFDTVRVWSLEPADPIAWDDQSIGKDEVAPIWLGDLADAVSGQGGNSEEDSDVMKKRTLKGVAAEYLDQVKKDMQDTTYKKYVAIWQRFFPNGEDKPEPTP